jgi:hypothetical protein
MPNLTKAEKLKRDRGAITGLRKYFADQTLTLRQKRYTCEELVAVFEAHLRALADVDERTVEQRVAVQKERNLEKRVSALASSVKSLASGRFGAGAAELREFGREPDKKPVMSAETKHRANEKRQATRKERGIMGRRQRKKARQAGG